jgi:hypothetical protein
MTVGALVARTALIIVTFTGIALAQLSHRPPPGPFDRCEMQGRGADPALNAQMNRIERVEVGETFTVARMELLPAVPARDGALRENWPSAVSTHIAWLEKHGVSFAGYIVRAEMENPGPANCGSKALRDRDVRIYIADRPGESIADAAIAEVTPRWRAVNPSWTAANLQRLAISQKQVLIQGWLLYDSASWNTARHREQATLWEIHPVTAISVRDEYGWVNLADYLRGGR